MEVDTVRVAAGGLSRIVDKGWMPLEIIAYIVITAL
jgi:hypothetical protein